VTLLLLDCVVRVRLYGIETYYFVKVLWPKRRSYLHYVEQHHGDEEPPEEEWFGAEEGLERGVRGEEFADGQDLETEGHYQNGRAQRQENFFAYTLEAFLAEFVRHDAPAEGGGKEGDNRKECKPSRRQCPGAFYTAEKLVVVGKDERNEEGEIQADDDVDGGLSAFKNCKEDKQSEDTKKVREFVHEI
jgi:hypothetical protein